MQVDQINKNIEILSGSFTPSEVSDLLLKSIDHQINNYKLRNLSNWIHDHKCDQAFYNQKIEQLESRKKELQEVITEAQSVGCNIDLAEKLELKLDKRDYKFAMS